MEITLLKAEICSVLRMRISQRLEKSQKTNQFKTSVATVEGKKQVVAAVDTMACVSLMELRLARDLKLQLRAPTMQIQSVTGTMMPVLGEVVASVQIAESTAILFGNSS